MNDMEPLNPASAPVFPPPTGETSLRIRTKTSQRLKYEAEIAVLKREIGGLEDLRIRLGFSRRKICQLLLVDPSAWTRWTSDGQDAPPHIYRALKWYLDSKNHQFDRFQELLEKLKGESHSLTSELVSVRRQMYRLKLFVYALFAGCFLSAVVAALVFGRLP